MWGVRLRPPKSLVLPSGPITASEASGPGEGGSDPDPMEWGSEVRAPGRGGWRLVEHILTAGLRGGESLGGLPSERMEPLTYLWALVGARASPHPCFFPRPPCWTQGLPTRRSPSTCSPTGPSGATQRVSGHSILGAAGGEQGYRGPGGDHWASPGSCSLPAFSFHTCKAGGVAGILLGLRESFPRFSSLGQGWWGASRWGSRPARPPPHPGPKGSQRQEVEVAIRNLRLCLDPGLPGRNPAQPRGPPSS